MPGKLDRLAKARAAKLQPPDTKMLKAQSAVWEAARLADLFADELVNPADYCARVAPAPTDGVCTHCHTKNALVCKRDLYGAYTNCVHCGSDYFDTEPVPLISNQGGRHTDGEQIGKHYATYEKKYKETKRKNAKS